MSLAVSLSLHLCCGLFLHLSVFLYASVCFPVLHLSRGLFLHLAICLSFSPHVSWPLPPSFCLSIALSVCLSVRLTVSVSLFLHLSFHLSCGLSLLLSVCRSLSGSLSATLSLRLSRGRSLHLPVCLPVCLPACLPDFLSVCQSFSLPLLLSLSTFKHLVFLLLTNLMFMWACSRDFKVHSEMKVKWEEMVERYRIYFMVGLLCFSFVLILDR